MYFWSVGLVQGLLKDMSFNPCSGGMYFWRRWCWYPGRAVHTSVSILVLVECTSEDRALAPAMPRQHRRFNPCSGGMYFWRIFATQPLRGAIVSILVLVECTSEVGDTETFQALYPGFNPCSGGMYFWSARKSGPSAPNIMFQSLFWWNVLLKSPHCIASTMPHVVSILVLVECTSEATWPTWPPRRWRVSILVLVECTSEGRLFVGPLIDIPCFNPCSGGMYFWSRWSNRCDDLRVAFQSLFWWNVLLKDADQFGAAQYGLPVSILVLVECTSEEFAQPTQENMERLFQSLFWWNVLLKFHDALKFYCLELAFQSLFWWNVLLKRSLSLVPVLPTSFNPCSGGMYFWSKYASEGNGKP